MSDQTLVVGAGSAGAVVAARMTESGAHRVLLLEAGPDHPGAVPTDLADGTRNSTRAHDWGFWHRTSPRGPIHPFPRGRVVGGSSAVNTCIALRGQPYDYDEWADRGLPEWTWERCLPAFKRLERDLDVRNEWHGADGPIPIRRHPVGELTLWQQAFLAGCESLGFPACDDHNDPTTTGHGPHAMNKIDGVRQSVARCYLTPEVRARENLEIRGDTLVRRVLFEGRRAVGVEVEAGGRVEVIRGRRVILAGGAICTPGILLRSGVGPRGAVERLGATPVAEVPGVAAHLLDHPGAAIILAPRPGVCSTRDPVIQSTLRYQSEGSPVPNDMQLQPGNFLMFPAGDLPAVSLMCCVGKPRGRCRITFTSPDPRARPRIESDFLMDPEDLERAVEAMELAMLVATSEPVRDLVRFFLPGERVLLSRARMREWIHAQTGSGYHPCGTVPMGADDDPLAATDQYGRVRGVEGLLVVDASLMPTVPSANTNLPTIMMGERFGEWLRDGVV